MKISQLLVVLGSMCVAVPGMAASADPLCGGDKVNKGEKAEGSDSTDKSDKKDEKKEAKDKKSATKDAV